MEYKEMKKEMIHKQKVIDLKKRMIDVAYYSQQGFLASSFSILDILVVLYYEIFDKSEDEFILSKGHAVFALYAIMEDLGILEKNELKTFGAYKSRLTLMAERGRVSGIAFSTGSLGHGLPEAIGVAYAKKLKKEPGKVFVLVGDGELNEGTNWEAISVAAELGLNNLVLLIDNNKSLDNMVNNARLENRIEEFGWFVRNVDGHDRNQLFEAFSYEAFTPMVIFANTIKGKGSKLMEGNPSLWHSKVPNFEEYTILRGNLH